MEGAAACAQRALGIVPSALRCCCGSGAGFWRVSGDGFGGLGANECAPRTSRGQVRFLCPPRANVAFDGFVPL